MTNQLESTTTSRTNPEPFYSLTILDDMGKPSRDARNYVSGLMRISANRVSQSMALVETNKRKEVSVQIKSGAISESNLFYLKSYIKKYYPEMVDNIKFSKNT